LWSDNEQPLLVNWNEAGNRLLRYVRTIDHEPSVSAGDELSAGNSKSADASKPMGNVRG
jgi:hypothetical protein